MAHSASPAGAPRPVGSLVDYLREMVGETIDEQLMRRALTHRSFAYENGGLPHNERLEFLGDAVLGLVITDTLYASHPELPEGQLAKLRAAVVRMPALADVARTIGLGDHIFLGKGEEATGGRDKASILADTLEAVIGTVYLSAGLERATDVIHQLFDPLLAESAGLGAGLDWKTSLQEVAAELGLRAPEYRVDQEGPDHEKVFFARAMIGDEDLGAGTGRSKKDAEQKAAKKAWKALDARRSSVPGGTGAGAAVSTASDAPVDETPTY